MTQMFRWGLGFTFAAPVAVPLIAQSVVQPTDNQMWMLVLLPLLAMLGNALGGVALEFMKGVIVLWRAKVRARIRALGENPDNHVINGPITIGQDKPPWMKE
jgi:hypothetical protein